MTKSRYKIEAPYYPVQPYWVVYDKKTDQIMGKFLNRRMARVWKFALEECGGDKISIMSLVNIGRHSTFIDPKKGGCK